MRLKIAIPIIWMPILTIWAFIISMGINLPIEDFELIGSIGVYLFVSFLLAIQLQLICTKKKEIFIIKLGSVNFLLFFLTVSTVNIFLNISGVLSNEVAITLSISFLIFNTIFAELFSISNKKIINKKRKWNQTNFGLEEKQLKASIKSASQTTMSKNYRKEWSDFLQEATISFSNNPEILTEIRRIKEIVNYSSFSENPNALRC